MMTLDFRTLLCAAVLLTNVLAAAENPFIGTWKMKPDKSTFVSGQEMKEMTVSYTAEGDRIRRVASGTYLNGHQLDEGGSQGSILPWDGKSHTVHEGPHVVVMCTPVRDRTSQATMTMDGKLARQVVARVSADGKTLTENRDDYDSQGRKSKTVIVFDRQ